MLATSACTENFKMAPFKLNLKSMKTWRCGTQRTVKINSKRKKLKIFEERTLSKLLLRSQYHLDYIVKIKRNNYPASLYIWIKILLDDITTQESYNI